MCTQVGSGACGQQALAGCAGDRSGPAPQLSGAPAPQLQSTARPQVASPAPAPAGFSSFSVHSGFLV